MVHGRHQQTDHRSLKSARIPRAPCTLLRPPILIDTDADMAVRAIVAWEQVNEGLPPQRRSEAWARIA